MTQCPLAIVCRPLLLAIVFMVFSGVVHPQTSERSSWALGVHGMAEVGILRGSVNVPVAIGTAPGTTYENLAIIGGMTYGVGMQILVAFRPSSSLTTASFSLGMQRRHISASGTVGEPLQADLGASQADLLYDQSVTMVAIDGRHSIGAGWHVIGALGVELPLGSEQAALWVYETGPTYSVDRLERRSGVRYRTAVGDRERITVSAGLSRDVIVGMHGNTGVLLTPQLSIASGSSFAAGASWYPIVIRMGVALTWSV